MSNNSENNKRIAKNTLMLYFRMFLTMGVSLYTSRVVLSALGVEDYGIYNVVGGVVTIFSALTNSLSAAISRFTTVSMGVGDKEKLSRVFCTSINIQVILIAIIVILLETVGLWFLYNKLVIPENRMAAAFWVFQFSVVTFAVNLLSVPYNASIIAHEKMSVFAFLSIIDVTLKLLVAFLIMHEPFDRLVYYALLLMLVSIGNRFIYAFYCRKHFEECTYRLLIDKRTISEMFGFAGWNFIGAFSGVVRDQGGNIIINLFCGPAVNAARGIAVQVNSAVTGFISNFQMALNPQIMKQYAKGEKEYLFQLVFQGTRLCYFILLILSVPIIFNTPYILSLWLGEYPDHTVFFIQLILIYSLSESLSGPLVTTMLATGNIRNYQILVGGIQLLNLPLAYLCLRLGMPPEAVTMVAIVLSVACEMARLFMLRGMIGLSVRAFLSQVYCKVIIVTIVASILPVIYTLFASEHTFLSFVISALLCVLSAALSILYVGCDKQERAFVYRKSIQIINKITRK